MDRPPRGVARPRAAALNLSDDAIRDLCRRNGVDGIDCRRVGARRTGSGDKAGASTWTVEDARPEIGFGGGVSTRRPGLQGVGINPETHEALLSDPDTGTLYTFTMLDNTVTTVTLPSTGQPGSGAPLNQVGFGAAAASPLEDVGIAVNANSTAVVVDLANRIVLQTVGGLGASTMAQAVAVDPVSNQAVVVNHEGGRMPGSGTGRCCRRRKGCGRCPRK